MNKLQALFEALKMTGKASADLGSAGLRAGKEFAVNNPRVASAIGGGVGGGALAKILGNSQPEVDSEDQEKRLRLMQMYGE